MYLRKWGEIAVEKLKDGLYRQVLHANTVTIARIMLDAGAVVPQHAHPNEQISTVESGRLLFLMDGQEIEARAGESVLIPSGVPHEVRALEASAALDVFSPAREDWKRGDDSYLRSR